MRKTSLTVILALGLALFLGGCSLLNAGTPRGSDGRVTESTVISASDLVEGDCFTFNSADGGVVDEVTAMPCAEPHEYIIIGHGKLSAATVASAGSLQNAVSVACKPNFETFKAAIKGGIRPKQEFMVFPETDEPGSDQFYSCMATDPDQGVIPTTPESTPTP